MQTLKVITFSGPSGAGKSTAMKLLREAFNVLEERYMELNTYKLDNRLVLSKWNYTNYWFNSILAAKEQGKNLLLTDRSPIDTCAYVSIAANDLLQVVLQSMSELKSLNINIVKILVIADFEILQERIEARLLTEIERKNYHEHNVEHNKKAYDFYEKNDFLWDDKIDTSKLTFEEIFDKFSDVIKKTKN